MKHQIGRFSCVVILCLIGLPLSAQRGDSLIKSLQAELFHPDSSTIRLVDYLSVRKCEEHQMDTTLLIRAQQPNVKQALTLLKEIILLKDSSLFKPVQAIYDRQMEYFIVEFEDVYLKNFYACGRVQEQFDLLKGFEIALTSIDYARKGFDSKQIFDHFMEKITFDSKVEGTERQNLIKASLPYHEHYRKLRSKAWLGGTVPFTAIDPYLNGLEPFFIEWLEQSDWQDTMKYRSNYLLFSNSSYFYYFDDPRIADYMVRNVASWDDHIYFFYEYAGRHSLAELTQTLVKHWLSIRERVLVKSAFLRVLLSDRSLNDQNFDLFMRELLRYHQGKPDAIIYEIERYIGRDYAINWLTENKRDLDKALNAGEVLETLEKRKKLAKKGQSF